MPISMVFASKICGNNRKHCKLYIFRYFLDFCLYGSQEPLNTLKILPQHTPTFSTIENAIPKIFQKSTFVCIFPPEAQFPPPTHFHRTSISPSTVFLIFGTPLDISATPYNVDILSSDTFLNSWEPSYSIFRRKTYLKFCFQGGTFFECFLWKQYIYIYMCVSHWEYVYFIGNMCIS